MPDFFGRMVSLMNTQAQTNLINQEAKDYGLLAQERQLQIQRQQQQFRDDQLYRQILADRANGIGSTQVRGDQQIYTGDPVISGLQSQLRDEQASIVQLRQITGMLVWQQVRSSTIRIRRHFVQHGKG